MFSDSVSEDGTGERTGGSGRTGWSPLPGVGSLPAGEVIGEMHTVPLTLSAQLLPAGMDLVIYFLFKKNVLNNTYNKLINYSSTPE